MPERKYGQRALACPECGNTVYPGIAPVVMVAVMDGDRLLMTKYADRSLPQWVLISGFVEAGETLEEAAEGIVRIKNVNPVTLSNRLFTLSELKIFLFFRYTK